MMGFFGTSYEIHELGHPVLYQAAEPVTDFADQELAQLIKAMGKLMKARGGVGIAAPQLGVSLQVMIVASRPNARYPHAPDMEPVVLINPTILWQSPMQTVDWEGCLSVPGIRGRVTRSAEVKLRYHTVSAEPRAVHWKNFPARIFLHEYDHLLGKTFLDRVDSVRDLYSEKEFLKRVSKSSR